MNHRRDGYHWSKVLFTVLFRGIGSAQLESLGIKCCRVENDGSYEMLEGCLNVKKLIVTCEHITECTATAAYLRNPATLLRDLKQWT